jgi:hypothetical protein
MPRGYQVLECGPGGLFIAMPGRDMDPYFAHCAAFERSVVVRMDVEERDFTVAVLQVIGIDGDHQRDPTTRAQIPRTWQAVSC